MRYPKFLLNAFATLGVFAFIFLACSVAEDVVNDDTVIVDDEVVVVDDENPPPIENNYGKYQTSTVLYTNSSGSAAAIYTTILNTETGQVKLYSANSSESWVYQLRRSENIGGF